MFRITQYIQALLAASAASPHPPRPGPPATAAAGAGPVVIWNLTRRCNLACRHCYTHSADADFPGELSTAEALAVLDDLRAAAVPVVIFSGGEPLLRRDLFELTARARALGLRVALSSNGTLIDAGTIAAIAAAGYDHVGVSLDGLPPTHDRFRRRAGAFARSLAALRLLRRAGVPTGLRTTLTLENARELPALLALAGDEGIGRFYLSHLNYAGRGNRNRGDDATLATTRAAVEVLFEAALASAEAGDGRSFVTGNNDADGAFFWLWARRRFPARVAMLRQRLLAWGGNASGIGVANIDPRGDVHPDTFWAHHTLGNVRERPFAAIWEAAGDPLMAGLRARPRRIGGRCGRCRHAAICNGNTRIRALRLTGDVWAADPGCYLSDDEIADADATPPPPAGAGEVADVPAPA